jgi:hypothetical protein
MGTDEYRRFEFSYGIVLFRTKRFQSIMDRLGSNRVSKPAGRFLLYLMPIAAAMGFYIFLTELTVLLSPRGVAVASYVRTLSPLGNLGLPGINPYIPIVDGWIALVLAMIIHEGAHGVVARSLGLPVKTAGLMFFLVVPIGAFVEIDEGPLREARLSNSGKVWAAGAGINLLAGLLCLLILLAVVGSMAPATSGAGIVNVGSGTPASAAGVKPGDVITQVDGQNVTNLNMVLGPNSTLKAGQSINLTVFRDGKIVPIDNVRLACCINETNTQTNKTISYPYIGVSQVTGSYIRLVLSDYTTPFKNVFLYFAIPTLPAYQEVVPFSDTMSAFYTTPLGPYAFPLSNLLYWFFFLNLMLAIFNSLPIYPLDGGQAFRVVVKALGNGRLSEKNLMRITAVATLAVVVMIAAVLAVPYLL